MINQEQGFTMWETVCRNGAFALVVLVGSAAWSQAQPYRGGWPPPPPAVGLLPST